MAKILVRKNKNLHAICPIDKKDKRFYRFKQIKCKPVEVLKNGVRVIDENNNISFGDKIKFGTEEVIVVDN